MTCNTCNDCEPKCHECCNPNIISGNCVTVETSEEGVIKINAECPTKVQSSDETIRVEELGPEEGFSHVYDLSCKKEDKLVGACSNDKNPGPLNRKISVDSPLTMEVVGCDGNNARIHLGLDQDEIDFPDEKVAVSASCEPGYLKDLLDSNVTGLKFTQRGCKMVLERSSKPRGKIVMTTTAKGRIQSGSDETAAWWMLGGDQILTNLSTSQYFSITNFVNEIPNGGMEYNNGVLICRKSGWYNVGYSGNAEFSFGIHAARIVLHHVDTNGYVKDILESRYSGPVGIEPYEYRVDTKEHGTIKGYNAVYLTSGTGSDTGKEASGLSSSLGGYLSRVPFGNSTLLYMNEGDCLVLGIKIQTETEYHGDYLEWEKEGGSWAVLGKAGSYAGTESGAEIRATYDD